MLQYVKIVSYSGLSIHFSGPVQEPVIELSAGMFLLLNYYILVFKYYIYSMMCDQRIRMN